MIKHSSVKTASRALGGQARISCHRHKDDREREQFPLIITSSRLSGTDVEFDSSWESEGRMTAKYRLSPKGARALYAVLGQVLKPKASKKRKASKK